MNTTRRLLRALIVSTVLFASSAIANAPVEVVGLFKNRAVVKTAAGSEMIKVGQTSNSGVTLVSATAREAKVKFQGKQYRLTLSGRVSGSYKPTSKASISIAPDSYGQYRIRGAINASYVNFLVDTGASVVALSSQVAEGIGLNYKKGRLGAVETAQGTVSSHYIKLDVVNVGGIRVHNVEAAVIQGNYPTDILLGMSYLKQVAMAENAGVMSLTQKH